MPKSSNKPLGKKPVQSPVKKQAIKAQVVPKVKLSKGGKVGTSISDKHRFAKPGGWRFKDSAEGKTLDGKKITRADLAHTPSKKIRTKYPKYVAFEDRLNKSDAHPTRSSKDSI